jgi:hypothetical protein
MGKLLESLLGFQHELRERLLRAETLENADLIFVLGGQRNRKVYGARLFRERWAPQILMSTGDPPYIARVIQKELDHTALVDPLVWNRIHETASLPSLKEGQFFVGLDSHQWLIEPIRVKWFGTLCEIKALAQWLQQRPLIRTLLVVSAGMHLRRVSMCCRQLLPRHCQVRLIAVPEGMRELYAKGEQPRLETGRRILLEWAKLISYYFVLGFLLGGKTPKEYRQ